MPDTRTARSLYLWLRVHGDNELAEITRARCLFTVELCRLALTRGQRAYQLQRQDKQFLDVRYFDYSLDFGDYHDGEDEWLESGDMDKRGWQIARQPDELTDFAHARTQNNCMCCAADEVWWEACPKHDTTPLETAAVPVQVFARRLARLRRVRDRTLGALIGQLAGREKSALGPFYDRLQELGLLD